jgi:hypothetical protein
MSKFNLKSQMEQDIYKELNALYDAVINANETGQLRDEPRGLEKQNMCLTAQYIKPHLFGGLPSSSRVLSCFIL